MFLTGELDPVRSFMPAEAMNGWVTDLRSEIVVPGAGHWVQQQAPARSTRRCSASSPTSSAVLLGCPRAPGRRAPPGAQLEPSRCS